MLSSANSNIKKVKIARKSLGVKLSLWAIGFGLIGFISARIIHPQKDLSKQNTPLKGVFDKIVFSELKIGPIPCPDILLISPSSQKHLLTNFRGNVIVLRFTRFHPQDLPSLIYLDALAARLVRDGLKVFIIHELEKSDKRAYNNNFIKNAVLIEDDGYISSLLGAQLNDFILVDRNFEIQIKNNQLNDRTAYHLLCEYLFGTSYVPEQPSSQDQVDCVRNLSYINVRNNQHEYISDILGEKAVALTLFISPCLVCSVQYRINMNTILKSSQDDLGIIFLFHPENPVEVVREWMEKYIPSDTITIGIIEKDKNSAETKSDLIFKYYIDPFMILFDRKGHLLFSEEPQDRSKLNSTFFESLLK